MVQKKANTTCWLKVKRSNVQTALNGGLAANTGSFPLTDEKQIRFKEDEHICQHYRNK